MSALDFEAVAARAGHECRGGLLVGLGTKIPKSEFLKAFHLDTVSAAVASQLQAQRAQRVGLSAPSLKGM